MLIIIVNTGDELTAKVDRILRRLDTITERTARMATQKDVDAVVAQLDTLGAALVGIQSDIDTLVANQNAGEVIDLTALQAKVTALVEQGVAIDAENPAPTPVEPV